MQANLEGAAFASRLVVEGARPGWVYRCEPINEYDTGWRFLVGSESDEWLNAPDAANCVLGHLSHTVESWPELRSVVTDNRRESQWEWNSSIAGYEDVTDPEWTPEP